MSRLTIGDKIKIIRWGVARIEKHEAMPFGSTRYTTERVAKKATNGLLHSVCYQEGCLKWQPIKKSVLARWIRSWMRRAS